MNSGKYTRGLAALVLCALALGGARAARAQQPQQGPVTNAEFLAVVRQLPARPGLKDQLVGEIRRRGINFTLTSGLRSFVATKSGNDEELRRVLEEAERRFLNPTVAKALPSSAEAADLLQKTRAATVEATGQMPDFVVKQLVTRSHAAGRTQNWVTDDRLVIGVSFRESQGEKYRLLAINGIASASQSDEQSDYTSVGGTSSTGEFVTQLKELFDDASKTDFKFVDEESLRGRRTLVFDFEIKRENSRLQVGYGKERAVIAGQRGRIWIDREKARVLRVERAATEMPADFPVMASDQAIDYDWVTIQGQGDYLLPARAVLVMTAAEGGRVEQSRNDIRFRNYQKYGTELKIIEDDIIDDETPQQKPKKP
ncbi:MAG: hypothetical protein DMF67_06920 [Acidobacteria bacterium]|nr:MAG: hypothetical protein DMF66_13685 [Acidobacteriota bacterium]PYS83992.1 MAG: hypothetical protein DMF67_06920 [Acidobacteriota bacterium]